MTTKITEKNISSLANAGVSWQSVVVADGSTGLTAVAGRGYFINTTSGTITVTLPTSANVGDVIVLKDYARTWATNNVTIASTTLDGFTNNPSFSTNGQTVTLVYMDNTKGFSLINEDTTTDVGARYVVATGGTITTLGNFKIHAFTNDGSFVVATAGNPAGSDTVDYLVVGGGGGGGKGGPTASGGGGGGGGGFRLFASPNIEFTGTAAPTSPLNGPASLPVSITTYPISVGGGGAGAVCQGAKGSQGGSSIFSTITSAGGGGGGSLSVGIPVNRDGGPGGSGGGASGRCGSVTVGTGNTPPVSPPQGNPGGASVSTPPAQGSGGGGGAVAAGAAGTSSTGGVGGAGGGYPSSFFNLTGEFDGSGYFYSGGGGGGSTTASVGAGGFGGGGAAAAGPGAANGTAGTANTGGGGGGASQSPSNGGAGGKGIVLIRYKFQN